MRSPGSPRLLAEALDVGLAAPDQMRSTSWSGSGRRLGGRRPRCAGNAPAKQRPNSGGALCPGGGWGSCVSGSVCSMASVGFEYAPRSSAVSSGLRHRPSHPIEDDRDQGDQDESQTLYGSCYGNIPLRRVFQQPQPRPTDPCAHGVHPCIGEQDRAVRADHICRESANDQSSAFAVLGRLADAGVAVVVRTARPVETVTECAA